MNVKHNMATKGKPREELCWLLKTFSSPNVFVPEGSNCIQPAKLGPSRGCVSACGVATARTSNGENNLFKRHYPSLPVEDGGPKLAFSTVGH